MNKIWLAAGAAALIWLGTKAYSQAKLLQQMSFTLEEVKVLSYASGGNINLRIAYGITNPSEIGFVRFKGVTGKIYYKGIEFGQFSQFGDVQIMPQAKTNVYVPISLKWVNIFAAVGDAILGILDGNLEATIKWTVITNVGNYPGEYTKALTKA